MVFPVVLAVGALALYFLTKPKSKNDTSDFNSKSVDKIISDSKYVNKEKFFKEKINQIPKDERFLGKSNKPKNDSFVEVYHNPNSVFKNSKGQKLKGKTILSKWQKQTKFTIEEQKKYDALSLKEQVIQVKKDSPKMIKFFDEWKKQD
tara:strand:- start:123 stop:566 length:444 start_codon:yes stop_codon:yes gene_type:complete